MSALLDPLALPLWGSRLIEASAGTGKTWTIAGLYLRLVLGHGSDETRFGAPLAPPQVLVMTFTRAATRELSNRIRARLVEAADCFRGTRAAATDDALLGALVDAYPAGPAREAAAWRLAMAAEGMDDAAVFTIDAWVQRMLREHAFDSGCLFDEEVQPDELAMLDEAVRDYWRQEVYPLDDRTLDAVLSIWPNVGALAADVMRLRADLPEDGDEGPGDSLATLWHREHLERARLLSSLKKDWPIRTAKMRSWLLEQIGSPDGPFLGARMQRPRIEEWTDRLARWAGDPTQAEPGLTKAALFRLTRSGLTDALRPGRSVDIPVQFEAFPQLVAALAALPEPVHAVRLHAARRVERRLRTLKRRAGIYGFDDMLKRLDAALRGPAGERLRGRIVAQYPVAMIDEFQDTSTVQYRIFDRLYAAAANDRATALLLIGDPKQSIFAFRRADIRSYLRARAAMGDRHYVLGTNYRSTTALVATVNRLFCHAEERGDDGAFRYGATLPFVPVDARGRRAALVGSGGPVPALTLAHDAVLSSKFEARHRFAEACAAHIVAALNDPRTGFDDPVDGFRKLAMSDITVLVRDRHEAAVVRLALRRRGVATVYLSDQDSVFGTPEAADLLHWLRAVAEPTDGRRARVAYATALVGLSLDRLARLGHDDVAFDAHLEDLRILNGVWRRQGVLPMLRRTLHLLDLPARWLRDADGERRLTNVLHLAELLQAAGATLEGEHALIRWLAEQVGRKRVAADEQIVRLESDADLVKVMTVWTAKGLEYPVVYLPFVCSYREATADDVTVDVHDDGTRSLRLAVTDADRKRSLLESQQEDIRLLYVAMTRACHALWLGIAPLKGKKNGCAFCHSAFGYLVGGLREVAADEIAGLLRRVFADLPSVALVDLDPEAPTTTLRGRQRLPALLDAPDYAGVFERDWSIGSFSAFVRDLARAPTSATVVDPVVEEELRSAAGEDDAAIPSSCAAPSLPARRAARQLPARPVAVAGRTSVRARRRCRPAGRARSTLRTRGLGTPGARRRRLAGRGRRRAIATDRRGAGRARDDLAGDGVLVPERRHRRGRHRPAVPSTPARRPRASAAAGADAARHADGLRRPRVREQRPVLGARLQVERARRRRRRLHARRTRALDGRPSLRRAGRDLPARAASAAAAAARRRLRTAAPAGRRAVPLPARDRGPGLGLLRRRADDRVARRARRRAAGGDGGAAMRGERDDDAGGRVAEGDGSRVATLAAIADWADRGWIRRLDAALARFVADLCPAAPGAVLLATALVAHLEGQGHTCLVLDPLLGEPGHGLTWNDEAQAALDALLGAMPRDVAAWTACLSQCEAVDAGDAEGSGTPLVLAGTRLYLRRYWRHERRVADAVGDRVGRFVEVDQPLARRTLDRLFPGAAGGRGTIDWQKVACAIALRGRLSIVTGGPGTGKTWTAARFIALLEATDPSPGRLRVALAAPTGKAAARLKQSIDAALATLRPLAGDQLALWPSLAERLGPAKTLHALLGTRRDSRRFRHDASNPLDVDVVIVDEASMVHLEMMDALLDALPADARVLLLGDKDQLASVEAGAVLGELCRDADAAPVTPATARYVEAVTGEVLSPAAIDAAAPALDQQIVTLRRGQRFGGAIDRLAQAVNAGDATRAAALLDGPADAAVAWRSPTTSDAVIDLAVDGRPDAPGGYRRYLEALRHRPEAAGGDDETAWIRAVLTAFDTFRVLCAVRDGAWGVEGLNRAIAARLAEAGLLAPGGEWYEGRPVLVTRNDYGLGVFNGDIGVALRVAPGSPHLRVWFGDGADVRSVGVARLGQVETAFALTVHKAQGSEFDHTVLVLPTDDSIVATRELVYTGVTRARAAFTLVSARRESLAVAVARQTRRSSGLLGFIREADRPALR